MAEPEAEEVQTTLVDRGVHRRKPLTACDEKTLDSFHEGDRLQGFWKPDGIWYPCHFVSWKGRNRRPKVMWADGSVSLLQVGEVRSRTATEVANEERAAAIAREARKRGSVDETSEAVSEFAIDVDGGFARAEKKGRLKRPRAEPMADGDPQLQATGDVVDDLAEDATKLRKKRARAEAMVAGLACPSSMEFIPRHQLPAHRYVLAPMVGGSELPYRMLTRRYGAQLCYTPMMYSGPFAADAAYRESVEHGFHTCPEDRPLVAHFCGNDPEVLLAAARHVADRVDAIDLNLGCPQRVAHAGHFGSYLLGEEDRELLCAIVKRLAESLPAPVFCKIRLLDDPESTIRLVRQLEASGAALIAVHARYRGTPTHRRDGPAHLDQIPAIKQALRVPVLANGNVRSWADVVANLKSTGADGIMSAEGILDDPCLFFPACGGAVASKGGGNLRKLEKKLRQIEGLRQKAAGGAKLSAQEEAKVASGKALRKERKRLIGDAGSGSASEPVTGLPSNGLEKARLYLEMCRTYQMPILPTVLFHCRRMAKIELTNYQLLDEFKSAPDLDAATKILAQAEAYHARPETFVFDEAKVQKARELQAKMAYEEECRKKFEARMKRKAEKEGRPLSDFLRPSKVPGGQLKGAADPSWLQENEGR